MRSILRLCTALILGSAVLVSAPSVAAPDGQNIVIDEIYVNGGSNGAVLNNKFVELYNPTDSPISVSGWSLQYRPFGNVATFTSTVALGDHTIPAGGRFLIGGNSNNNVPDTLVGEALPTPDASTGTAWSGNNNGGVFALSSSAAPMNGTLAQLFDNSALVDLIGYGNAATYENVLDGTGGPATGYSVTTSVARTGGVDTDNNVADFSAAVPTPTACGQACDPGGPTPTEPTPTVPTPTPTVPTPTVPTPTPTPSVVTIEEIQGTSDASPLVGQTVTTRGVVTAVYPTGGFSGGYIQTPGTGGELDLSTHVASSGLFVYSSAFAGAFQLGDYVEVTGPIVEFQGLTEISPAAGNWTLLSDPVEEVKPAVIEFPLTEVERETLEGMLVAPEGTFTITNNYSTNQYAELGLAAGATPLRQPTDVARPGSVEYTELVAANAERLVTLDDGASVNFLSGANRNIPVPWLATDNQVRTGAQVDFTAPVVLDYRNGLWKLQPTTQLTADGVEPITISDTRNAAPDEVGGDVKIATFNVLNYFTTVGEDYVAAGMGSCTYYSDREGNRITVNSCTNNGPRGAADQVNLERQEAKIVAALTALDADVIALEEIENSAAYGIDRDTALNTLVAALNEAEGAGTWAAVASPTTLPTTEDVIRTAFIYRTATVEAIGESVIYEDPAFSNAREPLSQEFRPVGGNELDDFIVIVNHFKSKGSGTGEDADTGDGQGASNASRVRQSTALVDFAAAESLRADTEQVFLTGDFNSYSKEDPIQILEEAGFVNVAATLDPEAFTYQFGGLHGSLDHVFASAAAFQNVTGADIWEINADESVGREYSRFNNNVTQLYDPSPFRASDHDPIVVGLDRTSVDVDPRDAQLTASESSARYPLPAIINVEAASGVNGVLIAYRGTKPVGVGAVVNGRGAVATLPFVLGRGTHDITVRFLGSSQFDPDSAQTQVRVR